MLLFPTAVNADAYVICIQQQLSQLSIDVGKVDGLFGSNTRNGIEQIRAQNSELGSFPEPTKENASVWCRKLGIQFGLKEFWPSKALQVRVETEQSISEGKRRLLERTTREVHKFLLSGLEVEIPSSLIVLASTTMSHLVSVTADELQGIESKQAIKRQLKAQCDNRDYVSGASYGGVVALCPNGKLGNTGSWTEADNSGLRRLLAHELSHEIHTQLAGNYRRGGKGDLRGPKWLTEGAAIALELEFGVPELSAAEQVLWFKEQLSYQGTRLRQMSNKETRVDRNFQLYAGYAGVLLASKHSHRAFGVFWSSTPVLGWEQSFEFAFGQSVGDFYRSFGVE